MNINKNGKNMIGLNLNNIFTAFFPLIVELCTEINVKNLKLMIFFYEKS